MKKVQLLLRLPWLRQKSEKIKIPGSGKQECGTESKAQEVWLSRRL